MLMHQHDCDDGPMELYAHVHMSQCYHAYILHPNVGAHHGHLQTHVSASAPLLPHSDKQARMREKG